MTKPHIADGEAAPFMVVNIAPDFCIVDGAVVPFDIFQYLSSEKSTYAKKVFARGQKTLTMESVILGVVGNAGAGVISGRSLANGHVMIVEGDPSVMIEGKPAARDGHVVLMNGE